MSPTRRPRPLPAKATPPVDAAASDKDDRSELTLAEPVQTPRLETDEDREMRLWKDVEYTVDVDSGRRPWMRTAMALALIASVGFGIWAWLCEPDAPPVAVETTPAPSRFEALSALVLAFPLDADDSAIADFLSRFVVEASHLTPQQQELAKEMWNARRHAIEVARAKAETQAVASVKAQVRVRTQAQNAVVSIDDGEPQTAPAAFADVKFGAHTVEVRAPGYGKVRRGIQVIDSTALSLDVTLERAVGQIILDPIPADAAWVLTDADGKEAPHSGQGFAMMHLPTGRYSVTFVCEGHEAIEQHISIDDNSPTRCTPFFPQGLLLVHSAAKAVSISIDGKPRGLTPVKATLSAGTHDVEADFGDGAPQRQQILIANRETARIEFQPAAPRTPAAATAPIAEFPKNTATPVPASTVASERPASPPPAAARPAVAASVAVGSAPLPERAYSATEVTRAPEPLKQPSPEAPRGFANAGAEGRVDVELVIDATGNVETATVVRSTHAELEKPTLAAVRVWKFKPALRGAAPSRARVRVPVVFRVE